MVGRGVRAPLGTLMAVALVLGACGSPRAAPGPAATRVNDKLEALVAAARAEGELQLSWTAGTMDAPGELQRYVELFNKSYGLELKVRFVPAGTAMENAARLADETQAARPAFTDVFVGAETEIGALERDGSL